MGYLGDGEATWILSGHVEHQSAAVCSWSLQVLCGHAEWPLLYWENKGQQRVWGRGPAILLRLPWPLEDSYTWVEWRPLGFVSGWEAPDCSRHGGSVWEAEPRKAWGGLCFDFCFVQLLIQKHSAWGPRGQASSLQQGLVLLRSCKQPVVVRKTKPNQTKQYFLFHRIMDMKENLNLTNSTINLPLPKNHVLRSWFLKWTVCSCWGFGWF